MICVGKTNTSNIDQDDTIILANNRQVLAFKKTWGIQKGNSALAYDERIQGTNVGGFIGICNL
jgi:hypothetical protein